MSDGAHKGVGAERALATILGFAPEPTDGECETVEQMKARILSAPIEAEASYDGCATACARLILEAWQRWPKLHAVPSEAVYLTDEHGGLVVIDDGLVELIPGLHSALKSVYRDRPDALAVLSALTGFMWGWALNAALRIIDQPPEPNPALLEIS